MELLRCRPHLVQHNRLVVRFACPVVVRPTQRELRASHACDGMRTASCPVMRHGKRWIWIWTGIAAGLVILAVLFVAAVPLSSDALRHRMIKTLSVRLN